MKNTADFEDKIKLAKEITNQLKNGNKGQQNSQAISDKKLAKIKKILNDEKALNQIMNSDTAKELLKKFGKE